VIGSRWVRLSQTADVIHAETALPQDTWDWLANYLQLEIELKRILETFPPDPPLLKAVAACRGLRLLRQDPWECLASFILSSTKQIVQIRQIVGVLSERYGESVAVPAGVAPSWQFPSAGRLASCSEAELRACKAGFRAPYLLAAARQVAGGEVDLAGLSRRPLAEARATLMSLPGVGRKIADCVLLFAAGFSRAFPVDVWVLRALRELYPRCRRLPPRRLLDFCETHFGAHGGYAQQYLFHYRRSARSRDAVQAGTGSFPDHG
jgi:N-glycosylase/DNA lyase